MKKLPLFLIISALASTPVFAANGGFTGPSTASNSPTESTSKGGFTGPNVSETTVAKAKELADDSWVILRGNIVKQLDDKHYEFTDGTGSMTIEISHKRWQGVHVTPADKVEIRGEIDKDWNSRVMEVKLIRLIK